MPVSALPVRDIPVGRNPDKDLYRLTAMQGGSAETVESRWGTFYRTDLVGFEGNSVEGKMASACRALLCFLG